MIQINPLKSYIDGGVRAAITSPPSASLVFDLPGRAIWVKGVKLKGTDHTYTFNHDNYINLTNTPGPNNSESEEIKIGININTLKAAIDTTYGVVTSTVDGLAPKFSNGNKSAASAATTYHFLGWAGTTLKWYQAPWRNIRINSETIDCLGVNSTDPLIISAGNGINVTWDSANKKIVITNSSPDVNHNTDNKVAQAHTSTNYDYPIILKGSNNLNENIVNVNFNKYLTFNPSTKILKINNTRVITTDDIYIGATSSTNATAGLVPAATSALRTYFLKGDGTWATPTNTWRPIKVGGSEKLGSGTDTGSIDFVAGNGITLAWDATNKRITITNSKPHVTDDTNTWRPIYLGGTIKLESGIGTAGMNLKAGSGVTITYAAPGTGSGLSGSANYGTYTINASNQIPADNVTGSGATNWIAKWSGEHTISKLVAISSTITSQTQSTKFLREDGTWATPSYTTNSNTWRPVKVEGTEKLSSAINTGALDLSAGNGISIVYNSDTKKVIITNTKPDINHNTHYTTMMYIGENNDTKANKNIANPYLKLFDDNARRATFQIKGGTGITIGSDANGNITITNSAPDVNHNTDRTGIKLTTVSGTKKTDSTLILANSTTGLNIQGGTNKFLIGNGTNYIEVPVTPSVSNKDATIGTTLTTLATIAGVDIKAKIASYSLSNHTHSVKINGSTKTIAAPGGTAIDLGSYLPLSGGTMSGPIKFSYNNNGNCNVSRTSGFSMFYGNLENATNYGFPFRYSSVISFMTEYCGMQFANYGDNGDNRLLFRNISGGDKWTPWYTLLHSGNSSVSGGGSSWGSSITININGTSKTLTIPSNPNTDITVKQTPKADNVNRPLMMINGSTSAGEQINTSMFSTGIYANASTKMITSNGFKKTGSSDSYLLLGGGGHKAISDFATNSHTHNYLPLSGGTMTGALNFKNNTWNLVGDDAYIGDCNVAGMIGIKSANTAVPGFAFHNNGGTLLGKLYASGSNIMWNGTALSLTGHTHTFDSLTSKPTTIAGYGITDALTNKIIFSKRDYQHYVILLCKIGIAATGNYHTINGTFWSQDYGSGRYQAAHINIHCSDWNNGHDKYYNFSPFGLRTKCRLVTCTYNSSQYIAVTYENVQATTVYFDGSYTNIDFTPVLYYTSNTNTVNNSEIYNSITNVSYNLIPFIPSSTVALHSSNTYFGTVSGTNVPITINGTTYTFSNSSHTHDNRYLRWSNSSADTNAMGWGTLTAANGYTILSHASSSDGGDMGWVYKNGQIFMQLDGYYYQNEGRFRVLDTSDITSFASASHTHPYLPLSGGTMSGNLTMGTNTIIFNSNTTSNWNVEADTGIKLLNTVGASATGAPGDYHIGLSVSGYYQFQLAAYGGGGSLLFRNGTRGSYGNWVTIIDSSNIGSQSVKYASSAGSVAWGNITGKPSSFTPTSHNHSFTLGATTITTGETRTAITGPFSVHTDASSEKAFSIYRGSAAEGVKHWVDDSMYHIEYTNDEDASSIAIRLINTDSERATNKGADAKDVTVYLDCYRNFYPSSNNTGSIGISSSKWANMYATTFHGSLDGNANTATKLQTTRTIWGQSFDGTNDINASLKLGGYLYMKFGGEWLSTIDNDGNGPIFGYALANKNRRAYYVGSPVYICGGSYNNYTSGITVNSSNNVGIGTISPSYKLHTVGDIYSSAYLRAASGFIKGNSSDSYVLLGGGGHKAVSDFATSGHTHNYAGSSSAGGAAYYSNCLKYTGTGDSVLTAYQTNNAFMESDASWASYIICNHGDGSSYYNLTIRMPFSGVPQYQRLVNGTYSGWKTFITSENISSQSVNYASSAGNADTVDGQHFNWNNNKNDHTYLWAASSSGQAYLVHRASISVNYANSAGSASYTKRLYANSTENLITYPGDYSLSYSRFQSGVSNIFPVSNNANGCITAHLHNGNYFAQIGLSSNKRMYYRTMMDQTLDSGVAWNEVAWTSDIPTVTNYYWANIKVSASSNTSTSPTFNTCYTSNWFRSTGSTGWYNESYSGGIYMEDTSYVRTYNSKAFYVSNTGNHAIYTAGGFATARTSGSLFSSYYNSTWYTDTIYSHGNGNISISAPGGSLYLSYNRGNTYFGGGTYYIDRNGYFNGSVNYASSSGNADTLDNYHASSFALQGADNNLMNHGNEFTFVPDSFSGTVWFNYRTKGGTNGNIIEYRFGNGKGGSLGTAIHTGNYTSYCAPASHTHSQYLTTHLTIYGLTILANGTSLGTYTPNSTSKTINITYSNVGAAAASHTHSYLPLAGGTMNANARISFNNNGNLYIGTEDNYGYVYFQDIASQNGPGYWCISQDGEASFNESVTAPTFYGELEGNASSATKASKLGSSTVGSGIRHFYLNAGTATASSATVGSTTRPMYLKAGVMTACNSSLTDYLPLTGGSLSGDLHVLRTSNDASVWAKYYNKTAIRMVASTAATYIQCGNYAWTDSVPMYITGPGTILGSTLYIKFSTIDASGSIYASHFYENSDIRYKRILKNLLINSNTIANLPLFDFEWIENNAIGTGTSALAVQQILPNLVSGTDKLTLDYGVLGTIAGITACKELVTLKSELLQLKEKVKLLEDKLRKYKNI